MSVDIAANSTWNSKTYGYYALFSLAMDMSYSYNNWSIKYYYTADTVLWGIDLDAVSNNAYAAGTAAGSLTNLIFGKLTLNSTGAGTTGTRKYVYSTEVVSAGATFSTANQTLSCATGSSTIGYFGSGTTTGSTPIGTMEKYTYSSDTRASGTSITARAYAAAAGSNTVGIFATGLNTSLVGSNSTSKYTYSGDTVTTGTALSSNAYGMAASGTQTVGYFSAGYADTLGIYLDKVEKYTYSGDSRTLGTALTGSPNWSQIGSGGCTGYGLFYTGSFNIKYNYTSESTLNATNAADYGQGHEYGYLMSTITGPCSTPAGFAQI